MTLREQSKKRKKRFCSLETKLNIIADYKNGIKIKDLNKKYKVNLCNINYWVRNEKNFKKRKHLSKKTIHGGAYKKIMLDEDDILKKIDIMFKNKQKINTRSIFNLLKSNYELGKDLQDNNIKSWIYRFVDKYQLKKRYFEKKKKKIVSEDNTLNTFNSSIELKDLETIEYNRLNNKPFYIKKVIHFKDIENE
jgi:transposase-like protein